MSITHSLLSKALAAVEQASTYRDPQALAPTLYHDRKMPHTHSPCIHACTRGLHTRHCPVSSSRSNLRLPGQSHGFGKPGQLQNPASVAATQAATEPRSRDVRVRRNTSQEKGDCRNRLPGQQAGASGPSHHPPACRTSPGRGLPPRPCPCPASMLHNDAVMMATHCQTHRLTTCMDNPTP